MTRVDPPGGHALRTWSASGADIPAGASGPLFQWLAGGQQAVTVDPASPPDVDALLSWAPTFDVVLWSPDAVVDLERLEAAAPDVTIVTMTPFGLRGPWADRAATEFTLQALSGAPAQRGSRAWPPMSSGGQHGEYMQGVFAAVAAFVALRRVVVSGGGGVIDLSGLEAVADDAAVQPAHDADPGRRRARAPLQGDGGRRRAVEGRLRRLRRRQPGPALARLLRHDRAPRVGGRRDPRQRVRAHRAQRRAEPGDPRVGRRPDVGRHRRAGVVAAHPVHRGRQRRDDPADGPLRVGTLLRRQPRRRVPAAGGAVPHAPADPWRRRGVGSASGRAADHDRRATGGACAVRTGRARRHAPVRRCARRRLHVVLGRPVLRPRARHVRRRRHPRRVDGAPRRRPADEPPPAHDGAVVGALAVLPRHEHEQARRHDRHVRRRRAATWPAG